MPDRSSHATGVHAVGPRRLTGNFVMVRADRLRLLIPGDDVLAVDYLGAVLAPMPGSEGLLCERGKEDGALYVAVSERMKALVDPPEGRYLSTQFAASGEAMHWCWNEIRILPEANYDVCALPAVAVGEDSPLREYVVIEGEVAYLCDAGRLLEFSLTPEHA